MDWPTIAVSVIVSVASSRLFGRRQVRPSEPETQAPDSRVPGLEHRLGVLEARVQSQSAALARANTEVAGVNMVPDAQTYDDEIIREIRAGKKIVAIKLYRERTGVGLKEAKDAVEAMERGL